MYIYIYLWVTYIDYKPPIWVPHIHVDSHDNNYITSVMTCLWHNFKMSNWGCLRLITRDPKHMISEICPWQTFVHTTNLASIFFSEQEEILGESSHVQVDVFNHFWFVGWSKYQVLRVTNWTNFHWMNKNCLEILAQSSWQFFQPLWTCQQHCYRLSVYEESQSYSNDMIHVDFEGH